MSAKQICLLPPQGVTAELSGSGKQLCATLSWQPPKVNAAAVGGYHVERTTWWPGIAPVTTRLTPTPVRECTFRDEAVVADQVNEYRVLAVNRYFPEVTGPYSFPAAAYGFAFLRYAEMVTELQALAADNPDICRLVDAGPAAGAGLRVWCMVLGDDTSNHPDRPGVFYAGNPHGSEVEGSDACMGVIREVVRGWREQDPVMLDLLRHVQVRIIPIHNPYGRLANEHGFAGSVRKNHPGHRRPPPLDPLAITHCWPWDYSPGTDLNRNFDAGWRYSGKPRDPASGTYPEKKPASAPETRALVRMARAFRPQISVNFHGPCGYPLIPDKWADGFAPVDQKLHYEVAREFAVRSAPVFCNEVPQLSPEPIREAGEVAVAWFYKEFYGAHLLPEGFYEQVPYESRLICVTGTVAIDELVAGDLAALVALARRVRGAGIAVHVRGTNGRPLPASVEVEGHMDPHCLPQQADRRHGAYRRILSPGRYTLRMSHPGYENKTLRVRTTPAAATEVNIRLRRARSK